MLGRFALIRRFSSSSSSTTTPPPAPVQSRALHQAHCDFEEGMPRRRVMPYDMNSPSPDYGVLSSCDIRIQPWALNGSGSAAAPARPPYPEP